MQTQHLAPDIAEERLDWFTYDIQPDGTQICAIRQRGVHRLASCSIGERRSSCSCC